MPRSILRLDEARTQRPPSEFAPAPDGRRKSHVRFDRPEISIRIGGGLPE